MNNENKIIGGILLITVVVIGAIIMLGGKSAPAPITATNISNGQVIRDASHKQGPDAAKVKVVEFGDYQCPYCGTAYPVLKQIQPDYGDKIQFVFRNFPLSSLHQNADASAKAAEAAALQNKFWEMHDKLYETQSSWDTSTNPKSVFTTYATQLGIDANKFSSDYDSDGVTKTIADDEGDGNALGVNATPTLYINGTKYDGSFDVSSIKSAIDGQLAK